MKKLIAIFVLLLNSPTHAMDLCESSGGDFEVFQDIQEAVNLPKVSAEFSITNDCQYTVKTHADMASSKSLGDFMADITGESTNVKSANSNLQSYKMKKVGDNSWEQTVNASKSGVSATVVSSCKYSTISASKMVFSCSLKGSNSYIEKNTTSITCVNGSAGVKKCTFETIGKAKPFKKLGITLKGPCDLAAGGAAETVNGVERLAQYISTGSVNSNKWKTPGAKFYNSAKSVQENPPGSFKMDIYK